MKGWINAIRFYLRNMGWHIFILVLCLPYLLINSKGQDWGYITVSLVFMFNLIDAIKQYKFCKKGKKLEEILNDMPKPALRKFIESYKQLKMEQENEKSI